MRKYFGSQRGSYATKSRGRLWLPQHRASCRAMNSQCILIVASTHCVASLNIKRQILRHYDFREIEKSHQGNSCFAAEVNDQDVKLVTLNVEPVHTQTLLDHYPSTGLAVFLSRHSSVSGIPTLSVHAPGNLGDAELGGVARQVSVSPAGFMRDVLKVMKRLRDDDDLDYEVSYECTHHGPSLRVPAMFAELGGSSEQWDDPEAAEVVAHSVMSAIKYFGGDRCRAVLGVGGPHYNLKFTKLALEENVAFGHIVPKYAIGNIGLDILRMCVARTLEKVESAILDWKGIKGSEKPKLLDMLEEVGLSYKKV